MKNEILCFMEKPEASNKKVQKEKIIFLNLFISKKPFMFRKLVCEIKTLKLFVSWSKMWQLTKQNLQKQIFQILLRQINREINVCM